jgi:co-chaperonin GroES (HSP10)
MKPLEDWMVVKLYEKQAARMDIKLAIPDSIDMSKDESAAFEIVKLGPGTEQCPVSHVKVGDTIILYGLGAVSRMELPNRKKIFVAQARNVCFILDKEDLV